MTDWSTAQIPDQSARTALVTGANSGIGLETVRELARRGASVILACRNADRARAALQDVDTSLSGDHAELSVELVDIGVQASVRALADRVATRYDRLDLLINNAGIMAVPRSLTVDGIESQLATNHLGHFQLTALLLPLLEAAPAARVVSVSSLAHRAGGFDFADMTLAGPGAYNPMSAYRRSKLANLLFAHELQRRLSTAGSSTISVAAHPGLTETRLATGGQRPLWWRTLRPVIGRILQSPAIGALPTLRAATDPSVSGSQYYGPGKLKEMTGPPVLVTSNPAGHDQELARRLWAWSEQATGLTFL